ncbi:hypothetical protein A3709_20800 [Halioglobus sp. HI00S01]|uniref:hypothetical protein n=1 Tax=Halioglobus sp. HI00S01 TaxID=1822214 RepID=UPI0007C3CD41|nr:hypothetical protein [Halioglobus sp. HI00S01]KZX58054.1 hypothetical protein A3709_20800 [Halioglobus sp. HI00S01]
MANYYLESATVVACTAEQADYAATVAAIVDLFMPDCALGEFYEENRLSDDALFTGFLGSLEAQDEILPLSEDHSIPRLLADARTLFERVDHDYGSLGFYTNAESSGLYISGEEYVNVDHVGEFLHWMINRFDLEPLGFTWASYCSKPRPDEAGGGACWVTRDEIRFMNSWSWLDEQQRPATGGRGPGAVIGETIDRMTASLPLINKTEASI